MSRRALLGLALAFLIPAAGFPHQFPQAKFFENAQPTRLGPDAAMFPDTQQRLKIDLSGEWRYTQDGSTWGRVGVPSAYDFTGRVTFQRTFEVKAEMLDKYVFTLVAYGINYQSEILINGNFVGRHLGGYSSFVLPVPANAIQVGTENAIRISVDDELTPKTTHPLRQQVGGWRTYGGIFRDIYLLAVPKLSIDDAVSRVELVNDQHGEVKSAKILVHATIADRGSMAPPAAGAAAPAPQGLLGFQVEIDDKLSGEMVARSGISPIIPQANKSVTVQAEAILQGPKLWSPETPDLYLLKCQIVRVVNKEPVVLDEFRRDLGAR
jgi:beta-galactosidase